MPGAKALVAAALERAARAGADAAVAYWEEAKKPIQERKHGGSGIPGCVMKEILALIPADHAEALAQMLAAVWAEAAELAGAAAVEMVMRQDPDASPLKVQMVRQAVTRPLRARADAQGGGKG
jgi:hypothetical protein